MKILLAGGGGEVGRYMARDLLGRGHEVAVLDRPERERDGGHIPGTTYFRGDLSDRALVREAVQGADMAINLAWSFADDPQAIFGGDIAGHINLLEEAAAAKVNAFIYTSTAVVYGRAMTHPVTETHPCLTGEARKPLYALGKQTAEELCRHYHRQKGLAATIFRFWWAFGDTIGGSNLRNLVRAAIRNEPLEMVRGAGGLFATMADLGRAALAAASTPAAAGETYNIGSLFLSWQEIGEIIISLTQSRSSVKFVPSGEWEGPAFLNEIWDLDVTKAEVQLAFKAASPREATKAQFARALTACVAQVKEETAAM
jgi:UDP-glucose 4-epimerase